MGAVEEFNFRTDIYSKPIDFRSLSYNLQHRHLTSITVCYLLPRKTMIYKSRRSIHISNSKYHSTNSRWLRAYLIADFTEFVLLFTAFFNPPNTLLTVFFPSEIAVSVVDVMSLASEVPLA